VAKARRFYSYTNRIRRCSVANKKRRARGGKRERERENEKEGEREIRCALFYGELYPGDIKYLITRSALKKGKLLLPSFRMRASKGGRASERASGRPLVIRAGRVIFRNGRRSSQARKGSRGIKIVFMECLKKNPYEEHFPAAFGELRG